MPSVSAYAAPANANAPAANASTVADSLAASITAAKEKLNKPPVAEGKNDPNAWMTNPINLTLYSQGGATPDEYQDMEDKNYTTVSDVKAAIKKAQELIDGNVEDEAQLTEAKEELDSVTERLKAVRVYDAFSGVDAYAKGYEDGQQWYDTCGYLIQAHGGQVSYISPSDITASYKKAGKANPYPNDCWYWIGEDRSGGGSSDAKAAFSLYSSKDLYNWNYRGVVLQKNLPADETGVAAGINISVYERPKLMYNKKTGKFVLWAHLDSTTTSGGNGYAAAMAGSAVNNTVDGIYEYQGRSRLHKLNDAQKNQYYWEQGYQAHASYGSTPWNAGPFWFEMESNRAFARDMNVFVDDDGTGYIVYASEENRTLFISRLNDDYTGLAVPDGEAVEGKDFVRLNPGQMREGPSLFKYNGKYYICTSGCNGWHPNMNTMWVADEIFGEWEDLGDVFVPDEGDDLSAYPEEWTSRLSFGTQSTNVIPVDPENGQYILMSDRWGNGGDRTSGYVWLPVNFNAANDDVDIYGESYWTLDDLASRNRMRITSEMPEYYFKTEDLPAVLDVEVLNDEGEWTVQKNAPVTWDAAENQKIIDGLAIMDNAEISGSVSVGGVRYPFDVNYLKVDDSALYLIDIGSEWVGGSDLFDNAEYMKKIRELAPSLRNSVADQPFSKADEKNPFGYTSTMVSKDQEHSAKTLYPGPTTSKTYDNSGYYINYQGGETRSGRNYTYDWETIAYRMKVDIAGRYTVSIGAYDWWGPVDRKFKLRASYTDKDGKEIVAESPELTNITKASHTFSFTVDNIPAEGTDITAEVVFISNAQGPENDKKENGMMANWMSLSMESASLTVNSVKYDKFVPGNIAVAMDKQSYKLDDILDSGKALRRGTDYFVDDNIVYISKDYLAALPAGTRTLTFDYSGGVDPVFTIEISDSTPASGNLQTSYDTYTDVEKGNYSDASWTAFRTALKAAKAVLENKNSTQGEIDKALSDLNSAYKALKVSAPVSKPVSKPIVKPKNVKVKAVKVKGSKKLNVKWKKVSSVSGYEIQYSVNKKFKSGVKLKKAGAKKTSLTLTKLKKGKKYYVRIRAYKKTKLNGANVVVYGSWSKAKLSKKIK